MPSRKLGMHDAGEGEINGDGCNRPNGHRGNDQANLATFYLLCELPRTRGLIRLRPPAMMPAVGHTCW
jgi:hypothetical protein